MDAVTRPWRVYNTAGSPTESQPTADFASARDAHDTAPPTASHVVDAPDQARALLEQVTAMAEFGSSGYRTLIHLLPSARPGKRDESRAHPNVARTASTKPELTRPHSASPPDAVTRAHERTLCKVLAAKERAVLRRCLHHWYRSMFAEVLSLDADGDMVCDVGRHARRHTPHPSPPTPPQRVVDNVAPCTTPETGSTRVHAAAPPQTSPNAQHTSDNDAANASPVMFRTHVKGYARVHLDRDGGGDESSQELEVRQTRVAWRLRRGRAQSQASSTDHALARDYRRRQRQMRRVLARLRRAASTPRPHSLRDRASRSRSAERLASPPEVGHDAVSHTSATARADTKGPARRVSRHRSRRRWCAQLLMHDRGIRHELRHLSADLRTRVRDILAGLTPHDEHVDAAADAEPHTERTTSPPRAATVEPLPPTQTVAKDESPVTTAGRATWTAEVRASTTPERVATRRSGLLAPCDLVDSATTDAACVTPPQERVEHDTAPDAVTHSTSHLEHAQATTTTSPSLADLDLVSPTSQQERARRETAVQEALDLLSTLLRQMPRQDEPVHDDDAGATSLNAPAPPLDAPTPQMSAVESSPHDAAAATVHFDGHPGQLYYYADGGYHPVRDWDKSYRHLQGRPLYYVQSDEDETTLRDDAGRRTRSIPRRTVVSHTTHGCSPLGFGRLNPYCAVCRARFNFVLVDRHMCPVRYGTPRLHGRRLQTRQLNACRWHGAHVFGSAQAQPHLTSTASVESDTDVMYDINKSGAPSEGVGKEVDDVVAARVRQRERRLRRRMKQLLWRDLPASRDRGSWDAYVASLREGVALMTSALSPTPGADVNTPDPSTKETANIEEVAT